MQENCTFSIIPYGINMSKIILYKKEKAKPLWHHLFYGTIAQPAMLFTAMQDANK